MIECPLVSIIVPIYNVEKYIYKSIYSVLNQTYNNLEIILVDDGSPDKCGAIVDEFEKKDSRVKVIHKQNGGLSDARNAGMRIATGKYIYFFDSDDCMDKMLIEKAVNAYCKMDVDLVCFNYIEENEESKNVRYTALPSVLHTFVEEKECIRFILKKYLMYEIGYCVWNKLYCLDIIRKNNINFEDNSKIFAEDICFNLYYLTHCKSAFVLPDHLYCYLIRTTSIMGQRKKAPKLDAYITLIKYYEDFLQQIQTKEIISNFTELIFVILQRAQLKMVQVEERKFWANNVADTEYFIRKNDDALYHLKKWIEIFGLCHGMKEWLRTIEYYYGSKKTFWLKTIQLLMIKREG